jgi:hypothetical protein
MCVSAVSVCYKADGSADAAVLGRQAVFHTAFSNLSTMSSMLTQLLLPLV